MGKHWKSGLWRSIICEGLCKKEHKIVSCIRKWLGTKYNVGYPYCSQTSFNYISFNQYSTLILWNRWTFLLKWLMFVCVPEYLSKIYTPSTVNICILSKRRLRMVCGISKYLLGGIFLPIFNNIHTIISMNFIYR